MLFFIQMTTMFAGVTTLGLLFISTIGFFFFITKLVSEIENKFNAMNSNEIKKRIELKYDRSYLKRMFVDAAQFHSEVLE